MIKKIADVPRPCLHPGHNPPMHMVYKPGVYSAEREAIQIAAMGIRYLYDISFRDVAVDA